MPFIVIQAHMEVQECSTQTALWINPEMDLISDLWQLQLNRELWDLGKHVVKWSKPGESRPTAKSTTRVDMTESFGATVPMRLPWASSPKPRSLLFCTRIGLSSFSNLLYAHMHTINFHIWYRPEYGGPCIMWPPHTLALPDSCLKRSLELKRRICSCSSKVNRTSIIYELAGTWFPCHPLSTYLQYKLSTYWTPCRIQSM